MPPKPPRCSQRNGPLSFAPLSPPVSGWFPDLAILGNEFPSNPVISERAVGGQMNTEITRNQGDSASSMAGSANLPNRAERNSTRILIATALEYGAIESRGAPSHPGGRRKVPALHAKSSVSPYSARSGEQNDLIGMLPPVANCKETH